MWKPSKFLLATAVGAGAAIMYNRPLLSQVPQLLYGTNGTTATRVAVSATGAMAVSIGSIQAGSGAAATFLPMGMLNKQFTVTPIPTGTESDMLTYSLPANTLNANGLGVRVTGWGTLFASTNSKTIKPYFGSAVLVSLSTTSNNLSWRCVYEAIRQSAGNQQTNVSCIAGAGANFSNVTQALTQSETGAITIKFTGTDATDGASGVVQNGMLVEFFQ